MARSGDHSGKGNRINLFAAQLNAGEHPLTGSQAAVWVLKDGFYQQSLGSGLNGWIDGAHCAGGDRLAHPWLHQLDGLTNFEAITELGRDINARFECVVFHQHGEDITLAEHITQLDLHIGNDPLHGGSEVAVANGGLLRNGSLP